MILVDTCGWIEALADTTLGRLYQPLLQAPDELIVPTIVQFELYKWLIRELGEDAADEIIATTEQTRVEPLTTEISLLAATLAHRHKLAAADALVYATAQHLEAKLMTSDAHFAGLQGVEYLPKRVLVGRMQSEL